MKDKSLKQKDREVFNKYLVKRNFATAAILFVMIVSVILLRELIYVILGYLIIGGFGLLLLLMIYLTTRKFLFKKTELREDSIFVNKVNFPLKRIYSVYVEGKKFTFACLLQKMKMLSEEWLRTLNFLIMFFLLKLKTTRPFFLFLKKRFL